MRNLVFVRHSQTWPDSDIPSREWFLSKEGRRRCEPLAVRLQPYDLDLIVTSVELKAVETGELVAKRLRIPCRAAANLHEHERESASYFETRAGFVEAVRNLFAYPDKLIFGDETGLAAKQRFEKAVDSVMVANPRENIAIVTHGTVLSLFVSDLTGCEIYPFWQKLGMPAVLAFSYPTMKLLAQVNEII
jgi:broad specificity phosphatase PhoE